MYLRVCVCVIFVEILFLKIELGRQELRVKIRFLFIKSQLIRILQQQKKHEE